jgi:hypothetical protein
MDNLEYCLFICSLRAERGGDAKLANDLGALATIYHTHESPGSDFDKSFEKIHGALARKYGELPYGDNAK